MARQPGSQAPENILLLYFGLYYYNLAFLIRPSDPAQFLKAKLTIRLTLLQKFKFKYRF